MTSSEKSLAQCVRMVGVITNMLIKIVSVSVLRWEMRRLSYIVAVGPAPRTPRLFTEDTSKGSFSQTADWVYGMESYQLSMSETGLLRD